jgi:hypothetical protein
VKWTRHQGIALSLNTLLFVTTVALSGCTQLREAPKDAEKLDADFHATMSRGDWKGIYQSADDGFRSSTSEDKFRAFVQAISRKLGNPVNSKQTSWRINATTSGTYLYSQCETTFSNNASGTESFVWRNADGKYRLYGYHINSQELITR